MHLIPWGIGVMVGYILSLTPNKIRMGLGLSRMIW